MASAAAAISRVRHACLALPEVEERLSHGAPTFFVRGKTAFVTVYAVGHHHHQFAHAWMAGAPGVQTELVDEAPERFFVPPYVGGRGWIGVRLDRGTGTDELAELCEDAYRTVAPTTLVRRIDEG